MNARLLAPFTKDEIERAIKQMHPSKAPGPDGFPALFYQKFWNEVGNVTTLDCLDMLNRKRSIRSWNDTHISLISKVKHPTLLSEFKPISLCNVSYKLISKVLVNRMKWMLKDVIYENQSAFVPGHSIFDNVIVGHECLHAIK